MANIQVRTFIFGIVALILVSAFISVSTLYRWIDSAETDGKTINVAGRQRMLTQKMMKEALLVQQGAPLQESLQKSQNLFNSSLNNLINGNEKEGFSPASGAVKDKLNEVMSLWNNYKVSLTTVSSGQVTSEQLKSFNADSITLLKTANQAVQLYEKQATKKINSLKNTSTLLFAVNLILAFLVFTFSKKRIIARLYSLKHAILRIEKDLNLTHRAPIDGNDEISKIGAAFNAMLVAFTKVCENTASTTQRAQKSFNSLNTISEDSIRSMQNQKSAFESVSVAME